jgi:hypothetical protein
MRLLGFSFGKCCALVLLQSCLATAQVSVVTQRYDSARDGVNSSETTLTPANVNTSTFGKLFTVPTDGKVFAQPLYMPNVTIPGSGTHNVLLIATQHDSVYAYDADGLQIQPFWTVNLATSSCPGGWTCTSVPASANANTTDVLPEVGITSTPVIDPSTDTMYVVAKTQEVSGGTTNFVYRLHALDITTGAERPNSPVVIQGQVPGSGSPNSGGYLVFSPRYSLQRPGLVLVNNDVYIAFGSWGDDDIWHGWLFGYDDASLAQVAAFSSTPNGGEGESGIWMHGNGLVADTNGYVYFSTGNGGFDGITNYGDSFLKLATPGLNVADYFTPFNQSILDAGDLDVASGGLMLLPDNAGTTQHPHILLGCGKNGAIYVMDRDNMGQFNSSNDNQIIQELLNVIGGTKVNNNSSIYVENCYSSPVYWQGNVYWGGINDTLKMFSFANGLMSTSPVSHSSAVYEFPGASPVLSSNGSTQGIIWTIENNGTLGSDATGTTAILHAYDATNLSTELYNTSQVSSDAPGAPVKFTMPVVANGKVYVGTQTSVAVYGLFSSMTQAAAPTLNPGSGSFSTAVSVSISDSSPGTTIYYTTNGSIPTTSSNVYSAPIVLTTNTTLSAIAVGSGYRTSPVSVGNYVITGGSSGAAFVQGNYSTPQSKQSTVSASFLNAQVAGDLNIVVVGWNDSTATIAPGGVIDSAGNQYSLAVGPTVQAGTATQAIYYAKSIVSAGPGSNTVTVTFSAPASAVDLRVAEYSGLDGNSPFDAGSGATGSSTISSVSLTTSNASEVIVAANLVQTATTGPGSGLTSRMITVPDGDIMEDEAATSAGTYNVSAPLSPSGLWIMQAAAFKPIGAITNPTIASIAPNSGPVAGGTAVTITGTNFAAGATVTFGTASATNVVVVSGTTITATTPAGSAGAVTVTVTNPNSQNGSLTNGFTYVSATAPTVTGISPSNGPVAGGTAVTITGTNFAAGATVKFGAASATNVVVVSGTTITATTPAGNAGAVTVTVTVNSQSGSLTNGFTYIAPPTVTSVSPNSGTTAGGTAVTITGTNFATGATVTFGTASATNVVVVSGTTITATAPAGSAGAVTVTVTNLGPQSGSLTNGYTYIAPPTVTNVSPNSGTTAGGTAVTITGTNFATGATVTFGGTAATSVVVVNSTTITATTPAHAAGAVTVAVTVSGQSGSLASGFTYTGTVAISFAQVAAATPQSTTATVNVTYPAAETGGDLNVVVVGWNDATATVQSVKDTVGNNYSLAIGPTSGTGLRQSIYYAANIVGGANTVTVAFNQAAAYPDVRILEYRGLTTLDVTAGASGSSTAANSGSATTTVANELIFGANTVATGNKTVGSGFTSRIITSPDSDLAEDKIVTAAGSNSASATLTSSGPWVMQMATFSAVTGPAPTVTSVSPNSGTTTGGMAVTITGTNFAAGATVAFGTAAATNVVVVNSTTITATTPAGSAGAVTVTVTANSQSGSLTNGYTYITSPTVTSVSPSSGPVAGGAAVTITGTNFAAGAAVTFGTAAATKVVVVSSTTITATTPAGSAGTVTVTVTNSGGQSGSLASAFTYLNPPIVMSVSPNSGSTGGGTAVTITGTNFAAGATVTFGTASATNVVVVNSTTITATTPAGTGSGVTVTVTLGGQSGSLTNAFSYLVVPAVSSVSPNSGPVAGGTAVTITGTNFATGATVTFGTASATNVVVMSGTTITATTPAGSAGAVTVTVTVGGQSGSLTNGFTYIAAPTVMSVSPNSGPVAGGTAVTITGTNFAAGATVTFGTASATNVVMVSGTTITATTPAGSAGAVTVTVTNPNSQNGSLTNGFTYVSATAPTVTGISPSNGPVAGGTAVTITGTNFAAGATVKFGAASATNVVVVSGTTITATTPAGNAGAVTVTVTVNSQSGSLTNGFTYIAPPTVTSVSPNSGTTAGGTAVTITGTNFATGATVTFGTASATNVVVVSGTTITATAPAGSAGAVTVTVTNLGPQSGSLTNGYTYIAPPTVTNVSPNSGTTAGGTAVTITGTNFATGATVTFGGTAATSVVVVNSTTITATTPAHAAGAVTVAVTVSGQSGSLASGFTYTGTVAISFAQVAAATPQSTTATVNVTYPAAETGGDLNVVVVGWNDATATVQSVKDTVGNNYSLAIGPTSGTGLRQSIYYAANIVGGANTVTVAFNQAAAYPDVRILEYRGLTTLDVTAGASGSSTAANSGSATTTVANELIFGANTVATGNKTVGSGFTSRIITSPDSDLAEDKIVTAAGSNSASATLTSSGPWVMQMATFSAVTGPAPTVTSVSPNSGTTTGGMAVTITGTNFAAGATVAFGTAAATNVVVVNSTTITATTPAGSAGAVTVTVTANSQSGSLTNGYTYITSPTVTSVSPSSGPVAGGAAVTITGTNFAAGAAVTFGTAAATKVVVVSSTTITATTPAGSAGTVTVTVTNSGGQSGSLASAFTYLNPPIVMSVSPNSGSTGGGTAVTITGTNFAAGATVTFGTASATNVVVVNSTTITATTPAGTGSGVTVTVTLGGQSGSLTNAFSYLVVPAVSSVSPNSGPVAGGTAVTITGTNFATGATVTFGTASATNVVVMSGTTITATTPAGSAGAVTVTVTVGGQSGSLTNGFTYIAAPTVMSVSPNSGPVAGGTAVTITGTNFAAGATVTFGTASATNVVMVSGTTITATTPAGSAGAVTVTVTNPGPQSGSLPNAFTFGGTVPTAPGGLTSGAGPIPTVVAVQGYINSNFQTTHTTAAFDSTGGDSIVLCASAHFGLTFTPSDSYGNTWIPIAGPTNTAFGYDLRTEIWYAPNPIVGPNHTVTMNLSQSMSLVMSVIVVKGSNTSSPIDAVSLIGSDGGTQTISVSSPNITTAGINDLLIGFTKVSAGANFQSGSGFTTQPAASSNFLDAETGPAATQGTYSATFTLDSPQTWQSGVVAVADNPNQTSLSWTASTELGGAISQYLVERCQGAGCSNFLQIGTTTSTSYRDSSLVASTSYSYRVRAQDTFGTDGLYSSVVSLSTPASMPSLPGSLAALSPSNTEVDLSWIPSTETGGTISDYLVERCLGATCSNFAQIGTSATTSYKDTGLTNGNTYNYRIRATDANSNLGPYSNQASAIAATPDTLAPTAPSNLVGTGVSSSQINLSWTASTDNVGVTGYYIERCQGTGCTLFFRVAVSSGTTYSDTGLAANTVYDYRVRATDATGNLSQYTSVVSVSTLASGSPNFTLSSSSATISIAPGTLGTDTITSAVSNGFSSAVSLSASGMPSGTAVSFNPNSIPAPGAGNSTMTITVGAGTPLGTYAITVTGVGAGVQQSITLTLTVTTASINFVQGNYATPQSPQSTVSVMFTNAQVAGDLNVVAVGWSDGTATVTSITDTAGNVYTLAVGPTVVSGVATQSIYYAKNIVGTAAGSNTVTVAFSAAAVYPDVRILEYSGADPTIPVDVTVAGTGNSGISSSGTLTTTNSTDLLFAANLVESGTTGAGSGFASRLLTVPDGDIAEDEMVATTGSYTATAPVSPTNSWIMQMVAFRASTH